jgi:phospholipase C
VPPFVAPHPSRPETGRVSAGIDTAIEWGNVHGREHSIGLGYRVPLVVASPWSRGGCVNSQVFDHTSILRFLEVWLAARGKRVRETNITDWRRTVCGDLTSVFRPYDGEALELPTPLSRDATVERIHAARFRPPPHGGAPLTKETIATAHVGAFQEAGTRPSCPLPYELLVNAEVRGAELTLVMEVRADAFGKAAQGAPFNVYSYGQEMTCRSYAVRAGDVVRDAIPVAATYRVRVDGPNGFMREFSRGSASGARGDVAIVVGHLGGKASSGKLEVRLTNARTTAREVTIRDESYGAPMRRVTLRPGERSSSVVDTSASHGWYDIAVSVAGVVNRYAGRIETGKWSISDPAMGGT